MENIKREMEYLLEEYGYEYTEYALSKILNEWAYNKANLIEAFKNHPNYIEGKHMIAFDTTHDRVIDKTLVANFSRWLCDMVVPAYRNIIPEEMQQQREREGCAYLPHLLYDFLGYLECYATETITAQTAEKLNSVIPSLKTREGAKTSRVVNKVCRYLGYDKFPDYQREFAKFSDAINPLKIVRHTVLSIHPVDYLTMSFGNSWASCHTIDKRNKRDMPNSYEGAYSSGTMSYMLDSCSMVFYTVDAAYNGNDYFTQDKITRQMFHFAEDKLVQGRLYPQSCDYGAEEAYTANRNIVQKIIADCFGFNNLWNLSKGTEKISKNVESYGTHYKDYYYYENCTMSTIQGSENNNKVHIGSRPICIECGYAHSEEESINCCHKNGGMTCADCGDEIDDDDVYWIDGDPYCRDCVSYCDRCETYHRMEDYYIDSEGIYVCEDCYNEYYTSCGHCGNNINIDNAYWVESDREYVCSSCYDRHYFTCGDCEEVYPLSEKCEYDGRDICANCYEEVAESEVC